MSNHDEQSSVSADIRVECYAGHRGEQEPVSFRLGVRRVDVVAVLDRWIGPDHRYFKVLGDDGARYILRHDEQGHRWELTLYDRRGSGEGFDTPRTPE